MQASAAKSLHKALLSLSKLLLLVLAAAWIVLPAQPVIAADIVDSGSIDLGGIVPGAPPSTGAVITVPSDGQHFKQSLITVSGTCPATTTVEIYKNNVFAGSTACTGGGTFSLQIDLFQGENRLLARVHDSLNQYGPDSPIVTVYYDVPTPTPSGGGSSAGGSGSIQPIPQLVVITDSIYQGQYKTRPLRINLEILGGQAPYAISIDWGDGSSDELISKPNGETFEIGHTYNEPGVYKIVIKVTDSVGNSAYMEISGVVNGPVYKTFGQEATTSSRFTKLINILFIVTTILFALISTFWAGKRWEFHELDEEHRIKSGNYYHQ